MDPRRVALLVETSTSWGSQIIAGVGDYVRREERWVLYLDHRGVFESQSVPDCWHGDGVVARVTSPALAQHLRLERIPSVNVSQVRVPGAAVQHVTTNERSVGELAAEVLVSAGFDHFAYYGPPRREFYVDNVSSSFVAALRRAGFDSVASMDPDASLRSDASPHLNLEALAEWLKNLPKPVGVLAWSTLGAHRVSEACWWAGLAVPATVSVLAGDHDHLVAELANPRLTCIDHAPRRVGYLAAVELARLMRGGSPEAPVSVEPAGAVYRDSVRRSAVDDSLVTRALEFIRANALRDIGVDDVLRAVPASRRSLEIRFHRTLGRGPATEIRRVRLQAARDLLAETEEPIRAVAARCGFSPEQLQRLLRAETSLTPTEYRQVHRRHPAHARAPAPHPVSSPSQETPNFGDARSDCRPAPRGGVVLPTVAPVCPTSSGTEERPVST